MSNRSIDKVSSTTVLTPPGFVRPTLSDEAHSVSTTQAARILGMSVNIVQRLVDECELHAWKTPGGHRRIDLLSLRSYQKKFQKLQGIPMKVRSLPLVSVVSDLPSSLGDWKQDLAKWSSSFEISFLTSLPDAFLSFSSNSPDFLIVDMAMPLPQQMDTVLALKKFVGFGHRPLFVVCMRCAPELNALFQNEAQFPMKILQQPLTSDWLKAFLTGAMAYRSMSA